MTTAGDIVAGARRFIGVRFAHQGRSAQGLDCLGLLLATAQVCGIDFTERAPDYGTRPDTDLLQAKLALHLQRVTDGTLQAADILLLNIDGRPQHLALLSDYPATGEFGMIHAYAVARKVVEHRYDAQWQRATQAVYRLPQLA
jgi:hypothetical protein